MENDNEQATTSSSAQMAAATFISLAYQNESESQFRQAQMNGGADRSSAFIGMISTTDVNDLQLERVVGFATLNPTESIIQEIYFVGMDEV